MTTPPRGAGTLLRRQEARAGAGARTLNQEFRGCGLRPIHTHRMRHGMRDAGLQCCSAVLYIVQPFGLLVYNYKAGEN